MDYPKIKSEHEIELTHVALTPGQFLCVYADGKQIEILVRADGEVGIFCDDYGLVLDFDEQAKWLLSD